MDNTQQLLRRITTLERRIDQLTARDTPTVTQWAAWTPRLGGSSTDGTISYTTQTGQYLQINDTVFVIGSIDVSTITTLPTGTLYLRDIPAGPIGIAALNVMGRANLSASYTRLGLRTPAAGSFFIFTEMGDDLNQNYSSANLNTNFSIQFSGFYRTS